MNEELVYNPIKKCKCSTVLICGENAADRNILIRQMLCEYSKGMYIFDPEEKFQHVLLYLQDSQKDIQI